MGRVVLAMCWAFRSRKMISSLSPPPSFFVALLASKPSIWSVVYGALAERVPLNPNDLDPPDTPFVVRDERLPPLSVMTRCRSCCVLAVALVGRLDRGAEGMLSELPLLGRFPLREDRFAAIDASISRSPSRSTRPPWLPRRLEMPPRVVELRLPRGPEGAESFRFPEGAIIATIEYFGGVGWLIEEMFMKLLCRNTFDGDNSAEVFIE